MLVQPQLLAPSMKNKSNLRKIIVNGEQYFWKVAHYNGDGDGGIGLRIFLGKKLIIDKYLHMLSVTPKFVTETIRDII